MPALILILPQLRYTQLKGGEIEDDIAKLGIEVSINSALNTLTIEDNGIGRDSLTSDSEFESLLIF